MDMENSSNINRQGQAPAQKQYVTVAVAEDPELAQEYIDILNSRRIETLTQSHADSIDKQVDILVPEGMAERAMEIIETQQQFDDFLDSAFNRRQFDDDEFEDGDEFDDELDDGYLDQDSDGFF